MIASPESTSEPRVSLARLTWFASLVFCGVLPAIALVVLFVATLQDDTVAIDFRQFYVAGEAIAQGESPYSESDPALWGGPYPYPPLPAQLAMPLVVFPFQVAGLIVMATLVLVALAVLFVVGVHDWRCYGLVLLWPPVLSAIQTGNVTLWLALALAQPRLGIVWFVPFGMVLTPGSGHPTPFETSVTLIVAAATIALAVRAAWASDARDARHASTSPVRA